MERSELWQVLFLAMLERIRTYPLARRPRKIAANLVLDVQHVTLAELQRARGGLQELPRDEPLEPAAQSSPFAVADVETPMRRAVASGAISTADAELLLPAEPAPAPDRGVVPAALRSCLSVVSPDEEVAVMSPNMEVAD